MRILLAVVSLLLVAGCSAGGGSQESEASPRPGLSSASGTASSSAGGGATSAPTRGGEGVDPCDLLKAEDLAALTGVEGLEATPGLTAGVPNCQWPVPDGRYVQVIASSSSDWALSLPEVLRVLGESGLALDAEQEQRLAQGARLVEGGGQVDPGEACELFSLLLELQGTPPGQPYTVNIVPSQEDPLAVTGQMCSGGRFTSVMVASIDGLAEPLPVQAVADAVQEAHRRTLV